MTLLALYARSAHWCSFVLDLIEDIAPRESRAMDLVDDRARRVSGLDGRLKCLVHSRTIANLGPVSLCRQKTRGRSQTDMSGEVSAVCGTQRWPVFVHAKLDICSCRVDGIVH